METPDLVQFIKDTKGSHPWSVSSVIRVAVTLYLKVQLFSNLSKEQKNLLVCNLVKKVLEEEKAELDKKLDLSENSVFEKILLAVDEVLPSVLEHIPVPELPKAVTRWFSFIPCSAISVGLHASEQLVSLANLKKVAEMVPAAAPLVSQLAEVAAVVVEVSQTVTQTVDEPKKEQEQEQEQKKEEDKA